MITYTTIKCEDQFNDYPGVGAFNEAMKNTGYGEYYKVVETDISDYWTNDPATIVIGINTDEITGIKLALAVAALGKVAVDLNADEYDSLSDRHYLVFRMWWD